ncbi:MAG: hypothetical protein Kow0059_06180 [Candidatus Sumerlaeia bacterium]
MTSFRILQSPFWAGWAMDAYPEMTTDELRRHIARQRDAGCNFLWAGHNNPGEVDRAKIEPGMSYAVFEALSRPSSPRRDEARDLYRAQIRLLEACRAEQMPVVFPVGYQIQMGEEWNSRHPEHLRRNKEGEIVNWGGRSASFYSPQYQEDIQRYYVWIIQHIVLPFSDVIMMINLADEPFGGDYSLFAEQEFRRRTGMTFSQAARAGNEGARALGAFQARYIAEYAAWSARTWQALDAARPTTMSLCGHHGREDYAMPYIPAVFDLTPESFFPTWDVYPRDGHFHHPVKETDITPLLVFLQQVGFLSARHRRPVFFWTTGNSWGLGQNSPDKANIADALVNQLYVFSAAGRHGAPPAGIAIWNYNIKHQGLYNDTNPIIYDPDVMFEKLTAGLRMLRDRAESPEPDVQPDPPDVLAPPAAATRPSPDPEADRRRPQPPPAGTPEVVITASRDYLFRFVARSGKAVYPFPFAPAHAHRLAKSRARVRLCETIGESTREIQALAAGGAAVVWVIWSDADDAEFAAGGGGWDALRSVAGLCRRISLPRALVDRGLSDGAITPAEARTLIAIDKPVAAWDAADHDRAFGALPAVDVYQFELDGSAVFYNLTHGDVPPPALRDDDLSEAEAVIVLGPEARVLHEGGGPGALAACPPVPHHGLCLIGRRSGFWMERLATLCADAAAPIK